MIVFIELRPPPPPSRVLSQLFTDPKKVSNYKREGRNDGNKRMSSLQKDLKNLVLLGLKNLTTWKMMLKRRNVINVVIGKTVIRVVVSNVEWGAARKTCTKYRSFPSWKKMVFCKLPGVCNSGIFTDFCYILKSILMSFMKTLRYGLEWLYNVSSAGKNKWHC